MFFYIEGAYDVTWHHGVLMKAYNYGIRGAMGYFLQNFLRDRSFRVRVGSILSDSFTQDNGVPQGGVLTRALEGGGAKNAHPSGFSRIAGKRRRAAPPFFQYLLTIEFDTLCKNFSPRSPKVRSPGQVKVKNGFLTLRLRSGHTRYPIGFKPSAFHKVIDTYNLYISDF